MLQQTAVDSGYWTLYRYDLCNTNEGKNLFQLDSKRIKIDMEKLLSKENRFRNLKRTQKDRAVVLQDQLKERSITRHSKFKRMSLDDEELLEVCAMRMSTPPCLPMPAHVPKRMSSCPSVRAHVDHMSTHMSALRR